MIPGSSSSMAVSSHTSGHGRHTTDEGNNSSSEDSSHSGEGTADQTPSQAGDDGTEKKSTAAASASKFGSLLAKATDALQSRPTRHGSFSEIEIEVPLQYPFPRKFVHQKLSEKDLDLR